MQDLRFHPHYHALPPPESVLAESFADLALFRQTSWQWSESRAGRLTTSWAASALGLFEERASQTVNLPAYLQSHSRALDAYNFLTKQPFRTKAQVLAAVNAQYDPGASGTEESFESDSWEVPSNDTAWDFDYCPNEATGARLAAAAELRPIDSVMVGRMSWGSIQESIGILAAVNFFVPAGGVVCEVGLLPLEANHTRAQLKTMYPQARGYIDCLGPVGASPDGLIELPGGRTAVLEVKSHSPFLRNRTRSDGFFLAGTNALPTDRISAPHMVQSHMHMLCTGPHCRRAYLFQMSVGGGCHVFCIERDDALLEKMVLYLGRFYAQFVNIRRPPTPNFTDLYGPRYLDFLRKVRDATANVKVHAHIQHENIQRGPAPRSLFLDQERSEW
eukprot:Plantae.Rhodophyta-Rhodochaete_pulchella.ctg4738.p1 GENE.Plantae.Rhodophyta-Rhodochaete_pulchella.ctg4738~~Plantae.Rhodophyta-Rhodochaete_pulchella.ctg4738.p1  ORF type:complete len:427 (+),score=31.83 Plantae.Rhodophyta-Rhodochaete_pulchella.ctg4738:115-1281(+)